jgi:hypothetical protein
VSVGVWEVGPTLEVRWIRPGALEASTIEWFGPFSGGIESREDNYLVDRRSEGLSVKIRGGVRLDVKVTRGSRGILDVPGRARGRIESWQKWSFPLPPVLEVGIESPDWISVRKIRRIRRFCIADDMPVERAPTKNDEATCAVELTDVTMGEEYWWTLGFETMGHPETLRRAIDATAALVFGDPLPDGPELGVADSKSYLEWLRDHSLQQDRRRESS